jgi:hypothetical protein
MTLPQGFTGAEFDAVWVAGPGDAYVGTSTGDVLRYDGTAWNPAAGYSKPASNPVTAFWGTSSGNVYALADTIVNHFDGTSWAALPSAPHLLSMWGLSETVLVVAGSGYIGTWTGSSWISIDMPSPVMNGVWGSGSDVFAVGSPAFSMNGSLEHCNGTCTLTSPTSTMAAAFHAVWGADNDHVYAVGDELTSTGHSTIFRYTSGAWSTMTPRSPAGLFGVWGAGADRVLAVGQGGEILYYDGNTSNSWSPMSDKPTGSPDLHAVSGDSSEVFAVGDRAIWRYVGTL